MDTPTNPDAGPQRGHDGGTSANVVDMHFPRRTILYTSLVCFLAWVFSVYDYTLFGTLLPKMANDFG